MFSVQVRCQPVRIHRVFIRSGRQNTQYWTCALSDIKISTRHWAKQFANITNPYNKPIKVRDIPHFTDKKTQPPRRKMTYLSHTADKSRSQDSFHRWGNKGSKRWHHCTRSHNMAKPWDLMLSLMACNFAHALPHLTCGWLSESHHPQGRTLDLQKSGNHRKGAPSHWPWPHSDEAAWRDPITSIEIHLSQTKSLLNLSWNLLPEH